MSSELGQLIKTAEDKEVELPPRYMLLGLVGSTGSGKSEMAKALQSNLSVPRYRVCIHEERYPENPHLASFYESPAGHSYNSQEFFIENKVDQLRGVRTTLSETAVIVDPALEMDLIFATAQNRMGWMSDAEYALYLEKYNGLQEMHDLLEPDFYIVVNAKPEIIRERVLERGRPFELSMVSEYPEYFDALHGYVESFRYKKDGPPAIYVDSGRTDFVNSPHGKWEAVGQVLKWMGYYLEKHMDGKGSDGSALIVPEYLR